MKASERLRELPARIEELVNEISDSFPAVSSGADDPMIDGLQALGKLEDLLDDALPLIADCIEAAEGEHPEPHNYWSQDAEGNEEFACPTCTALNALTAALQPPDEITGDGSGHALPPLIEGYSAPREDDPSSPPPPEGATAP